MMDLTQDMTVHDFETRLASIFHPVKPRQPEDLLGEDVYDSKSKYYHALGDAYEQYEGQEAIYLEEVKMYRYKRKVVFDAFKKWSCDAVFDEEIPTHVKHSAYNYACSITQEDDLADMYDKLLQIAELVEYSYHAGTSI